MQRMCVRVLSICVVVLGVAAPVAAQTTPRTEISGGYQFLSFEAEGESESMPKGWYADVTGNLTPVIGVVFQVGGNYKTFEESVTVGGFTLAASADLKVHEFLGGVRLSARQSSAFVPYGQFLLGAVNSSVDVTTTSTIPGVPSLSESDSATNFAIELGGGVNFGLTENTGIRFGVDYLRAFAGEEDVEDVDAFRFHVGIVFSR